LKRKKIDFSKIFFTTQEKKAMKEAETSVLVGKIPINVVGFLESVASSQEHDVKWSFIIDGEIVEENMQSLGVFESPRVFDPPYIVRSYIEIRAKNNTDKEPILKAYVGGSAYTSSPLENIEPIRPLEPLTSILTDIREDMQKKTPKGEVTDELITVTDQVYLLDGLATGETTKELNWTSASITNTGPGNLYFAVNKWKQPDAPMTVGETQNIDLSARGAIKKIYLVSDAGSTTTASIRALK
jgi:hypothetical protein